MSLYVPTDGVWSPAVAPGRLWVQNGGWQRVRTVSAFDAERGWVQVYRWPGEGPAVVAPDGVVVTYEPTLPEVRLVVSNRFETWRIVGTVDVFTGGAFVSSSRVDVLADLVSLADPGVTSGEVRFTVQYRNPDTGVLGPIAVFSRFLGLEA